MHPQQVVKRVDEVFALIAEDMIEDLLVIVSYDLHKATVTHPEDPKPLSLR